MSNVKIPCDNGPYRDGKGSLYEGGTRVVALANWPGHIKPGITADGMIHVVDMYPTLAVLAGRLDGEMHAARWHGCLGDHQRKQTVAAHGNRL